MASIGAYHEHQRFENKSFDEIIGSNNYFKNCHIKSLKGNDNILQRCTITEMNGDSNYLYYCCGLHRHKGKGNNGTVLPAANPIYYGPELRSSLNYLTNDEYNRIVARHNPDNISNNIQINNWVSENVFIQEEIEKEGAVHDNLLCIICMSNHFNTMLFPCRHAHFCGKCTVAFQATNNRCPTCQAEITSAVDYYL